MRLTTKDLNAILKNIEFMEKAMGEINQLVLIDIYRTLYPTATEYILQDRPYVRLPVKSQYIQKDRYHT